MGLVVVTGVRFDVFEIGLFRTADSVRFGSVLVMSDVTEDGNTIPMTTAECSRGGGSRCCVWLKFVSQGAGPVAPPISECLRTVVLFQNGGMVSVYIVDAMASGDSQPGADLSGIDFRVHEQILWNAPESVVTLDSPGVVVLDTLCVPDVLGLRTRDADAEPVRVLPGRAPSVFRF